MTPHHRNVLLEVQYALDHVVWSYRSELDHSPTKNLTADDICLADFAFRTGALVRSVLDADNQRRGPQLAFRPPAGDVERRFPDRRLAEAIRARRQEKLAKPDDARNDSLLPRNEEANELMPPEVEDSEGAPPDVPPLPRAPLRRRF